MWYGRSLVDDDLDLTGGGYPNGMAFFLRTMGTVSCASAVSIASAKLQLPESKCDKVLQLLHGLECNVGNRPYILSAPTVT